MIAILGLGGKHPTVEVGDLKIIIETRYVGCDYNGYKNEN